MTTQLSAFDWPCARRAEWHRGWILAFLLLFSPLQFCRGQQAATAPSPTFASVAESQVKAAYLYKFCSYIEWPEHTFANAETPLSIAVRGADSLANELIKIVASHTINGRPVIVRKLGPDDSLAGINVLFVGNEYRERYNEIFGSLKGQPILIVTESGEALTHGSMINFLLVDGRVRFEAAPRAARQNNLTISARLLAAAYRIIAETS